MRRTTTWKRLIEEPEDGKEERRRLKKRTVVDCRKTGKEEKPLTGEGEKAAVHSPGDGLQFEQLHARPCSRRQAAQ